MSYRAKIATADLDAILADKVASIGDGEATVRREYNLTAEELNELMLDQGYERCPKCRWYVETWQMLSDESEPKAGCDQCDPRPLD